MIGRRSRTPGGQDRPVRTGSLRRRVVLGVLALLLVVLVGLGAVVNLVLGDRLRSDLRQRLADRAGLAQVLADQGLRGQPLVNRLTFQGVTASLDTGGQIMTGQDAGPPPGPGRHGRPPRPPVADHPAIQQSGQQLSASVPVAGGTLTLRTSLTDIDRTLATLRGVELAAGTATLLVTGLGLTWVVWAALAPLDRMTALARYIRDGARGRRLRPTRPRTEIGRTAGAFDDMLDALEAAEAQARAAQERMRQFLADASHDLRTPVAGVILAAERLLRDNPEREVREERLVDLVREGRRAARLVDDIVLISRLDAEGTTPPLRRQAVDVTTLALGAARRSGRQDRAPAVRLTGDLAAHPVAGDADRLDRLLTNLLDNARRAARPDGVVEIHLSRDDGWIVLDVTDAGPGVPPADRERIFDRFVRLDEHRGAAGSGLGLPIARAVAQMHGGTLICQARSDHRPGVTFRLRLPAVSGTAPTAPVRADGTAALASASS